MERADIAVIGGGAVGLAVAARFARPDLTVVLLERHSRHGTETSSRNSEVIHAGIYYPKGSLKSLLCHEGRRMLYRYCAERGVGCKKLGKLIVAVDDAEAGKLEGLRALAAATGAEGLTMLTKDETRRRAPGVEAVASLWSPESGIVDSEGLMLAFLAEAQDKGALVQFNAEVTGVERREGGYALDLNGGQERLWAKSVVNSAGLSADKVAELAGIDVDAAGYRLHWCKGDYFRCRKDLGIPHLIYPMPAKHGLGVHLTLDMAGSARFGPDTTFVDSLDYAVDPAKAAAFAASVRRYLPGVAPEDLSPDQSGIRPKLSGPDDPHRDFIIEEESKRGLPGWVNLAGIESPGLTASMAIAQRVAALTG